MITFEINHPDFNEEPITLSLYFDSFYIGSNNRCHLRFPDQENVIYLKANQSEDKFAIESQSNHFFILNNKKYKGTLKCQEGDILQLGMATIKIIEIDLTKINKDISFKDEQEIFLKEHGHLHQILSSLERELIYEDGQKK